jgi:hypothetical protein
LSNSIDTDDYGKQDNHKEEGNADQSGNESLKDESCKNDGYANEHNQTDWCASWYIIPE